MSKHWNEDWLRKKYCDELLSTYEIAELTDVSAAAVGRSLNKFDIEIITVGERKKKRFGIQPAKNKQHFYTSYEWKKVAEEVRKRDGYKCLSCGKKQSALTRSLHVHHIRRVDSFTNESGEISEKAYDKSNLMSLCSSCHGKWENIPVKPQLIL